jgi:hypothetical protein
VKLSPQKMIVKNAEPNFIFENESVVKRMEREPGCVAEFMSPPKFFKSGEVFVKPENGEKYLCQRAALVKK